MADGFDLTKRQMELELNWWDFFQRKYFTNSHVWITKSHLHLCSSWPKHLAVFLEHQQHLNLEILVVPDTCCCWSSTKSPKENYCRWHVFWEASHCTSELHTYKVYTYSVHLCVSIQCVYIYIFKYTVCSHMHIICLHRTCMYVYLRAYAWQPGAGRETPWSQCRGEASKNTNMHQ